MAKKITYRLLNNQTGVILVRNPVLLSGAFTLRFPGMADKLSVEFENQGISYFRELRSGECQINTDKLQGAVKVTLLETASGSARRKWTCEELFVEHTDKGVWIYPNDGSLPQVVAKLRVENDDIRRELAALKKEFKALEKRFERMMEGYDVT